MKPIGEVPEAAISAGRPLTCSEILCAANGNGFLASNPFCPSPAPVPAEFDVSFRDKRLPVNIACESSVGMRVGSPVTSLRFDSVRVLL